MAESSKGLSYLSSILSIHQTSVHPIFAYKSPKRTPQCARSPRLRPEIHADQWGQVFQRKPRALAHLVWAQRWTEIQKWGSTGIWKKLQLWSLTTEEEEWMRREPWNLARRMEEEARRGMCGKWGCKRIALQNQTLSWWYNYGNWNRGKWSTLFHRSPSIIPGR